MGQRSICSKVSGSPREPLPILKVPVPLVCLSLHQDLASNQRNASVTTTGLTSTLGASTHWWQFRISLRCFNHSRASGHNFPLLRHMEDPLNYNHELGIKSRVETFFTQHGPFPREHQEILILGLALNWFLANLCTKANNAANHYLR